MALHEMEERFQRFAMTLPGAESIDELSLSTLQGKRADYLWRGRSVVAEVKVLRGDPQIKIDGMFAELSKRIDFPVIVGEVAAHKVLAHLSDGKDLLGALHEKVSRSVEANFRDAKRQIANTKTLLGLDDALGILVLLNPDIEALHPGNVGKFVSQLMLNRQSDVWSIDVVWLITEAHFTGNALPCVLIEGSRMDRFTWADAWVPNLNERWAAFNNSPLFISDAALLAEVSFQRKSERTTGLLTNEQHWRANYRANPYLASLDDGAVRAFGHQAFVDLIPYFTVGGPRKSMAEIEPLMERWTDFLEEASDRGLDLRGFGL